MASVAATEESTRISKKAAEASVLAAEVARQGAEMARRDVHRRRLEQVVDLIERIMVLARRVYNVDPLSGHILGSDESARAPLQAALVSLRTFVGALPDLLPKVKELSELGARENIGVQQVQGHYLYALDE